MNELKRFLVQFVMNVCDYYYHTIVGLVVDGTEAIAAVCVLAPLSFSGMHLGLYLLP